VCPQKQLSCFPQSWRAELAFSCNCTSGKHADKAWWENLKRKTDSKPSTITSLTWVSPFYPFLLFSPGSTANKATWPNCRRGRNWGIRAIKWISCRGGKPGLRGWRAQEAESNLPTEGNLTTGFLLSVLRKRKTLYEARDLRKRTDSA